MGNTVWMYFLFIFKNERLKAFPSLVMLLQHRHSSYWSFPSIPPLFLSPSLCFPLLAHNSPSSGFMSHVLLLSLLLSSSLPSFLCVYVCVCVCTYAWVCEGHATVCWLLTEWLSGVVFPNLCHIRVLSCLVCEVIETVFRCSAYDHLWRSEGPLESALSFYLYMCSRVQTQSSRLVLQVSFTCWVIPWALICLLAISMPFFWITVYRSTYWPICLIMCCLVLSVLCVV